MNRAAFDNPAVAGATNPGSFGWHHGEHMLRRGFMLSTYWAYAGPIPNNNTGWVPARQQAAVAASNQRENMLGIYSPSADYQQHQLSPRLTIMYCVPYA
jgi:hypothetical protein